MIIAENVLITAKKPFMAYSNQHRFNATIFVADRNQNIRIINVRSSILIACISSLLLSACYAPKYSAVPTATNFERTDQKVLQAASHWNLINGQVSKELVDMISGKVSKKERILIRPQDSTYSQQLYYDLIKSLTSVGYTVVKYDFKPNIQNRYEYQIEKNKPKHDVFIELKTEVLKFRNDRESQPFTGTLTKLAAGAWFLKVWDATNWAKGTALIAASDTADYFYRDKNYDGDPPKTEIVIDILAARNDEYFAVSKGVYYVAESDVAMYKAAQKAMEPLMHDYSITGDSK